MAQNKPHVQRHKRNEMPYTKSGYEAAKKYKAAHIRRVSLEMQIADYERLKAAADAAGERVNEYIKKAIIERMER